MSLITIKRRLDELERSQPPLGFRVFRQSLEDPKTYLAENGEPTTIEQINALSLQGWQVIAISWQTDNPDIVLTWGENVDESPGDWL